MSSNDISALIVVLAALAFTASLLRRLETIKRAVRRLVAVAVVMAVVLYGLSALRIPQQQALVLALIAAVAMVAALPKRSRYIRSSDRRRAIAKFELETGKKYNPRRHELDHEVPFSKGGDSTADNLRVISRRKNRRKGARSTWWDLFAK